ncbi:hypothetical protein GOV10_05635, partial [Candidatus Woesearchaeota archaeon]|nr:hypothetical protein [Candidatus Woesearchaeota archaeon]
NTPIMLLTANSAEQASREPIPFLLDTSMPYSEDVLHRRLRGAWGRKFPQYTLTELLDMVSDALNDNHYPTLLNEELMTWGERFVALDSFIDTSFNDVVFNTPSSEEGVLRNYFSAFPSKAQHDDKLNYDYAIGKDTPTIDEIIYSRGYLESLSKIKNKLDLDERDPQILPFENLLRILYLANHAKSYEHLALEAEGSNRPDITVDSYTHLVKAQRHMLAHNMQEYVSTMRDRFSLLRMDDDARLIGEEWDAFLESEVN